MEVSNVLGSPITRDEHQYQQQHYYRPTYSLPVNIDVNHNSKSDITTPTPQKPIPAFHPQTTAILHDDELHYNHNNTTVCRSDSISSQPYAFSPRTSLSSGSMFSSLDSPSSERWLNTDFDHDIHSPRRFRMTFTNTDPYNRQQIERCAQEQTLNQNESTYSPTEKRGSKDVLSQGEFGSRRNTDIESSAGQYYRTSFKSEKEVLGKQENLVPRSMWWILFYLIITNPIICLLNAFIAVIISIASIFYVPFTSRPTLTFIKSKLSPLLAVHLETTTGHRFEFSLDDVDTIKLVLVHLFSPFVAMGVYVVSLCLGVSWLYNLLLSDEATEDLTLKNWILKKWEGYLTYALKNSSQ